MKKNKLIKRFLLFCLLFLSLGRPAHADVYYVANSRPWSMGYDTSGMTNVFGQGAWILANYSTPAATIFAPNVTFVMLEGGDMNGNALGAFLNTNNLMITNWLNAGGRLYINAATNDTLADFDFGFEYSVTIINQTYSDAAHIIDMNHPIALGPNLPVDQNYTGNHATHGVLSGQGLIPLMTGDDPSEIVCAWQPAGCGAAYFGTLTLPGWWQPQAKAINLYYNIINYAAYSTLCNIPSNIVVSNETYSGCALTWTQTSGHYEIIIDQSNLIPGGSGTDIFTSQYFPSGLQEGTLYYYHIRTVCCNSKSNWVTGFFHTRNCQSPSAFVYSADTLIPNPGVTFAWPAVPSAVKYGYKLTNSTTDPTDQGTITTDTFATFTNLVPHVLYYLHVRSYCTNTDSSEWAAAIPFGTGGVTGVENVTVPELHISCEPNPTTDKVTLNIDADPSPGAVVTLTDINGRLLRNIKLTGRATNIDMRDLPSAVFLLKYTDKYTSKVIKVVKE